MKNTIAILLCFALILAASLTASACVGEDAVSYTQNAIEPEDIQAFSSTVVNIPDEDISVASDDVVYYGINQYKPEDFLTLTPTPVDGINGTIGTRASYTRLEFPGAIKGSVYSDFVENVISAGASATLDVNICVWAPESNDLEIGIYNWTTGENWYVTKSGGSISYYSKTFSNLTAGTYSVYIRNLGSNSLTTGYMLYNLT